MPIIHEEINTTSVEIEQKLRSKKIQFVLSNNKDNTENLGNKVGIKSTERTLNKIEKNTSVQISKLAESMAKMTAATMHKVEHERSTQISKLAESMARMTQATLQKIEQSEAEKISKIIENMHENVKATYNQVGPFSVNSGTYTKDTRVKENSNQPWFQ
jgi:DNA-binding XRE family transcriptional regulator